VRILAVPAATTRELRRAVLRPQWEPGRPMAGDDDPAAVHVAALDGADVLGACVLLPRAYPPHPERPGSWQLRGMAVAPARQRAGVGGRLLAGALALVRERGAALVWCDARVTAAPFYRRHGFAGEGPEFRHAETGLPHLRMWRDLGEPERPPTSSS
jgi:GNAT superfamily N-acetyltransferase